MLSDDMEMLMSHSRNCLHAGGELLAAATRIKTALVEAQKTPTNTASLQLLLDKFKKDCPGINAEAGLAINLFVLWAQQQKAYLNVGAPF